MIQVAFRAILRRPMRRLLAILAVVAGSACSSPCQDLATRICECQPTGSSKRACQRAVEAQIDDGSAGQGFCEQKLKTCPDVSDDPTLCDRLQTAEGKQLCGLAF